MTRPRLREFAAVAQFPKHRPVRSQRIFPLEMVDDIVKEFLVESYENLDQLDRDLMALEETLDDKARLLSVFRTIYTIQRHVGISRLSASGTYCPCR